jgi:hypothetical protein
VLPNLGVSGLGYAPLEKKQIPIEVVELIASQLALPHKVFQGFLL